MQRSVGFLAQAGIIAALYAVLTFPLTQFAFGPIQFRLAEALTVLAALTPAAIPGLTLGCLIANLLNPLNLGPVDILGGSLATLAASFLTYNWRTKPALKPSWSRLILMISPAVWLNALVVGSYLPFLIPGLSPKPGVIAGTIFSVFISQSASVYFLGLPLLISLKKIKLPL